MLIEEDRMSEWIYSQAQFTKAEVKQHNEILFHHWDVVPLNFIYSALY